VEGHNKNSTCLHFQIRSGAAAYTSSCFCHYSLNLMQAYLLKCKLLSKNVNYLIKYDQWRHLGWLRGSVDSQGFMIPIFPCNLYLD